MTLDCLKAILRSSRSRNTRLGLTGLLIYDDHQFVQVLEGEDAMVRLVYDRIRLDPRHTDVRLLYHGVTTERAFKAWPMGFEHYHRAVPIPTSTREILAQSEKQGSLLPDFVAQIQIERSLAAQGCRHRS